MKTHPAETFDCDVLHCDIAPIPTQALAEMVARVCEKFDIPPQACTLLDPSTEVDGYFLCGDYRVLITQSDPLIDKTRFNAAIPAQAPNALLPDATRMVAEANALTSVSVGKGLIGQSMLPDAMQADLGDEFGVISQAEEARFTLSLLAELVMELLKLRPANAVFWCPNSYILSPTTFSQLAEPKDKLALFIRPHLFEVHADKTLDGHSVGVTASGSQWLLGRMVSFRPSIAPEAFMVARLLQFVSFCLLRNQLLPDGDVFGKDANEKIRIHYQNGSGEGPDKIWLELEKSAELGINSVSPPTIVKQYDGTGVMVAQSIDGIDEDSLDPNDPIDAAILDRLSQLRSPEGAKASTTLMQTAPQAASETAPSAHATRPETPAEQPAIMTDVDETPKGEEVEPLRPFGRARPSERMSIEELRRIGQMHQTASLPVKAPNFLQKLAGRFKSGQS
ncbi:hypothetical protein J0X15_12280 [Roseibium sp. CAU 1637]|uniref:Uncharacterized protein n=1 Tax=Roseibium limicola TaxID=2816037 RepID=A0A939EP40_9HYPH|nr:hypothetical protein [Roseibium limicola]MBO0346002.1 hypothetical protein [Roseibium limicola]